MKQWSRMLIAMALAIVSFVLLTGCDGDDQQKTAEQNNMGVQMEYDSAQSFENALNDGIDCTGATVTFEVNDYRPDSVLGINCWAGEHLNFIVKSALDVSSGDIITGVVTGKPKKVLLNSWKIPFEVKNIEYVHPAEAEKTESNTIESAENTVPSVSNETIPFPPSEAAEIESTESTEVESTIDSSQINVPKLTASDLKVSSQNDYAHIDTESITLGNGEGVTITVKAPAMGLIPDDIIVLYDDELITVDAKIPLDSDGYTYFKYYITGNETCTTQFVIFTYYDYLAEGENAPGFFFDISKLDSQNGRVVYVTATGERYHYSEKCAGENAIKTTFYDATAGGYTACRKCAK